jgi:WD40 repeat protein
MGRKHTRIVARRGAFSDPARRNLLSPGEERPFAWQTYPENLYLRHTDGTKELWGLCRCGAAGPAVDLGWAGDVCGPCHDRCEEGVLPPFPGPKRTILVGHTSEVDAVRFAPDGRWLLSRGRYMRQTYAWDLVSGTGRVRDHTGHLVLGLAVLPDCRRIAQATGREVVFWDYVSGSDGPVLRTGRQWVLGVAASPDGSALAVNNWQDLAVYDPRTLKERWAVPLTHFMGPLRPESPVLEFSPDGRTLLCEAAGPALRFLDAATGETLGPDLPLARGARAAAFAADGSLLAVIDGMRTGPLRLWRLPSRVEAACPSDPVRAVALSPDGRWLATASGLTLTLWRMPFLHRTASGLTLTLWRMPFLHRVASFSWHTADINTVAFSPDGRWLATGAEDDLIKLWPVATMLGG